MDGIYYILFLITYSAFTHYENELSTGLMLREVLDDLCEASTNYFLIELRDLSDCSDLSLCSHVFGELL